MNFTFFMLKIFCLNFFLCRVLFQVIIMRALIGFEIGGEIWDFIRAIILILDVASKEQLILLLLIARLLNLRPMNLTRFDLVEHLTIINEKPIDRQFVMIFPVLNVHSMLIRWVANNFCPTKFKKAARVVYHGSGTNLIIIDSLLFLLQPQCVCIA